MHPCYGHIAKDMSELLQHLCLTKRQLLEPNSIGHGDKQHPCPYPFGICHPRNVRANNILPVPHNLGEQRNTP
jgi:hypothetical protein